ncbi:MAG: hypothetical protein ACOY3J_03180 [Bacillota bacterium]|uniref:DUF2238 domain-containing protein n=1 Tax=Thermanaerosceptrum fracticalcis TaxID=1712410 RepID=A0A7G6E5X5_THEFR|nr:hypothetical protein [Thermanaerosceptrum fracticalcis]QNB47479.1 hypothetical protein BR63_15020 [Thermanaerosceptrum fracticalcis]
MIKKTLFINTVFLAVQTLIITGLVLRKQTHYAVDTAVVLAAYLAFIYFEKKKQIHIENHLRVLVLLSLIGHNLIGEYFGAYKGQYFDKALHMFGAFSFALFAYSFLNKTIYLPVTSSLQVVIFITLLGIGLGTLFEILEFALDKMFQVQKQNGLTDTNFDLISDTLGALLAGFYGAHRQIKIK